MHYILIPIMYLLQLVATLYIIGYFCLLGYLLYRYLDEYIRLGTGIDFAAFKLISFVSLLWPAIAYEAFYYRNKP